MVYVVKIGGSLYPEHIKDLYEVLIKSDEKLVLINGGGELANKLREYNDKYHFSDDTNHWNAIMCMDIIGSQICDMCEDIVAIRSLDEISKVHKENKIPLLLVYDLLRCQDPLEHSWDVTSDSIACWLAGQLNAKLLILTNINGIYNGDIYSKKKRLIKNISPNELLFFDETCVDKCLPRLLLEYQVDCFILNGKYPSRIFRFLNNQFSLNEFYTHIGGELEW